MSKVSMYNVVDPSADLKYDKSLKEKDAEVKTYLICISAKYGYGDDMWSIVTGRTNAYNYIIENIDAIDFSNSFILVEGLALEHRKSIYAFCKYAKQFFDDSFDIDDYVKGDWDEKEYQLRNDIDPLFKDNNTKLSMEDIMNGKTSF